MLPEALKERLGRIRVLELRLGSHSPHSLALFISGPLSTPPLLVPWSLSAPLPNPIWDCVGGWFGSLGFVVVWVAVLGPFRLIRFKTGYKQPYSTTEP